MKRLIVTADDAGASAGVNEAVRRAVRRGVVTGVSFRAGGPALEEAAAWALAERCRRPLGLGVHLDLGVFFDARSDLPPQQWPFRDPRVPIDAVRADISSQLRALIDRGLPIHFASSRHHLHLRPELFPAVCETLAAFHVPHVRFFPAWGEAYPGADLSWLSGFLRKSGLAAVPHFIPGWYWGNVDERFTLAELACRPALDDDAGRRDLDACCDLRLREYLAWEGVSLTSFDQA